MACRWSLRGKPVSPSQVCRVGKAVTGLALVKEHMLLSSCADGSISVWDLRYPQPALVRSVTPDGRSEPLAAPETLTL